MYKAIQLITFLFSPCLDGSLIPFLLVPPTDLAGDSAPDSNFSFLKQPFTRPPSSTGLPSCSLKMKM